MASVKEGEESNEQAAAREQNEESINRLSKSKSNSVLGAKHRRNSPKHNLSIEKIEEAQKKQLDIKVAIPLSAREKDGKD